MKLGSRGGEQHRRKASTSNEKQKLLDKVGQRKRGFCLKPVIGKKASETLGDVLIVRKGGKENYRGGGFIQREEKGNLQRNKRKNRGDLG